MLAVAGAVAGAHIKLEVTDELLDHSSSPLMHPLTIKTEKVGSPGPGLGYPGQQYRQAYHPTHLPRLLYAPPPTPPSSEPGSPGGTSLPRRTPPPPYPAPPATSHPTTKYNRRNNPELEKRRIHHCDFIGE